MRVPPRKPAGAANVDEPRERVLRAAAVAYATHFERVPSGDARAIEAQVAEQAPDLSTAVAEALFHHGADAFAEAVRRALVTGAGVGS